MEQIKYAAIKFRGQVFTGAFHLDCHYAALGADTSFENLEKHYYELTNDEGFVTCSGRYVNREEALQIARAAAQTRTRMDYLLAEELVIP